MRCTLSLLSTLCVLGMCGSSNILMVTMGGSKSHKIPFLALSRGLTGRGHNVTFLNGYPPDVHLGGLEEITPARVVFYIRNFTNWDLLGTRMRGEEPVPPWEAVRYAYEVCEEFMSDPETVEFLGSRRTYDLIIMDGAYPECSMVLAHRFGAPYMYLNTVAFYTGSLSAAGNPAPYSVTPFFARSFSDTMTVLERALNSGYQLLMDSLHEFTIRFLVQGVLDKHLGRNAVNVIEMTKNSSFILQNGYATLTYPRPYLPNVAEIACIHCKPPKALPKELEAFIQKGGDLGFVYVSMGSAVKADNMPEQAKRLFLQVFEQLPYQVLWKWESEMDDLPENVMISKWLPQQDILGHKKIRAFVTHGGLLSMFETVYHGVPVITMPVFCDQEANAAKAELDGYAIQIELHTLTAEILLKAINRLVHEPRYRTEVKKRQLLLKDQRHTPLETAIYWTEYVIRHKGAIHLQSPSRHLNWLQYYLLDVLLLLLLSLLLASYTIYHFFKLLTSVARKNPTIDLKSIQNKVKLT